MDFMRRDDIPALTQAAIAHAQFETIHPFEDGNGRTGRAMVGALLRNKGVTEKVTIPISSGLLTDLRSYFEALSRYRDGEIQLIVLVGPMPTGLLPGGATSPALCRVLIRCH